MKLQFSISSSVSICLIAASLMAASAETSAYHALGRDVVEQLVFDVLLKDQKTEKVVKREGPISVFATDKCGQHRALIEEVVADINQAFGYGKLALLWRDEVRAPQDDEIVFLLGSVSDGRLLIERAGVSSPGSFQSGSYRYWYRSHIDRGLTRGLVAIDDSLPAEDVSVLARRYLLSVMGFRGITSRLRRNESFFSSDHLTPHRRGGEDFSKPQMLTEADSALLRFSDRWIAASMTWNKIRNVFDSKWPKTAENLRTPGLGPVKNRALDKNEPGVSGAPTHGELAESPSDSAQRIKREAVLACDVVVLAGNEKDEMASFRLRKGSKGRVVEEQARQSLLFFGSDRLIYVPSEAINSRGAAPPDEIKVRLLKPRDNTERIAANGMIEKRFMLNVNQMQIFRGSGGKKVQPFEAFSSAGVRFPEGSAAILTSSSELMVRTTPTIMEIVNAIMDAAKSSY